MACSLSHLPVSHCLWDFSSPSCYLALNFIPLLCHCAEILPNPHFLPTLCMPNIYTYTHTYGICIYTACTYAYIHVCIRTHTYQDFFIYLSILGFVFFFLFRAAPVSYGGSQARGLNGVAAASLPHSHINTGPKPHL